MASSTGVRRKRGRNIIGGLVIFAAGFMTADLVHERQQSVPFFGVSAQPRPGHPWGRAKDFSCVADGTCDEPTTGMFDRLSRLFETERERQRIIDMDTINEDDAGPKEISIHCPQSPKVKINNLPKYAQEINNECFVLNLDSPEIMARVVVNCDGRFTMPTFDNPT